MTRRRFTPRAGDERGAVMVMVVVFLPVLILFSSFVIDVGNWFEHNRHLQMQADAAALAAAGEFEAGCSDDAAMEDMARTYGGLKPPAPNTYNQQIGGTPLEAVLFEGLNRDTWPNQPGVVDPDPPGGTPCETGVIDVKLAEADLPWFFRVAQVSFINAHARVQFQTIDRAKGMLPIGVPDSNPKKAKAFFVDESKTPGEAGYVLAETMLCRVGTQDGLGVWSSAGGCGSGIGPVPVRIDTAHINTAHIGVRIALSGSDDINCDAALVVCYDTGTDDGLVHIRGWSAGTGSAQSPKARDVWLRKGGCPDGYFVAWTTTCAVEVVADVDFGSDPVNLGAQIDATVGNKSYRLVYDATEKLWKSDPTKLVPVPAAGSRVVVGLNWKIAKKADGTACSGTDQCSGTVEGAVQRAFSASDPRSGPLQGVRVDEHLPDGTLNPLGANSFRRCASAEDTTCVHDLSVTMTIKGSLLDLPSGPDDPPVEMRVIGGSQNHALNCDPDVPKFQDQIALGCEPWYAPNEGDGCPLNKQQLWATAQPWTCSALSVGNKTQELARGMNRRVHGDADAKTCVNPSRWKEYWADGDGPTATELANDPRLVWVVTTPFGAFDGAGNDETVPILQHAAFYATGWSGEGGVSNPCPTPPDDQPTASQGGYLVGHFLHYQKNINNGEGSGEACDFDSVQICVPVMTK